MMRLLLLCAASLCLLVTSCGKLAPLPAVPPTVEAVVPGEAAEADRNIGEAADATPAPAAAGMPAPTASDIPSSPEPTPPPPEAGWGELHF